MVEVDATTELEAIAGIPVDRLWLRPLGFMSGGAAGAAIARGIAQPLAGGPLAFSAVELLARRGEGRILSAVLALPALRAWSEARGGALAERVALLLHRLGAARPDWAGLTLDRPLLMGIVNTTPDSFSDGGDFFTASQAVAHGRALLDAGADILDIGGESTRPGAQPVSPEEELRRVEPVVRALAESGAVISIDTRHARVMEAALAGGARIVNDITALSGDAGSLAVVARAKAPVVLMHMQGEPRMMQQAPAYELASLDILEYLQERVAICTAGGIASAQIMVDPGIGFGKRSAHNLDIMARIGLFHALGCPLMLGVSRKGLIGQLDRDAPPKERVPGSLAGALFGVAQGVQLLRVHDVAATRQALMIWRAAAAGA